MAAILAYDSYDVNVKLCRAVELHPSIYDRENENFNKKNEVNEKAWALIARECEDSVYNCRQRWHKICIDVAKSIANIPKRKQRGIIRQFYLNDVLKFYTPHIRTLTELEKNSVGVAEQTEVSKTIEPTVTATVETTTTKITAAVVNTAINPNVETSKKRTHNENKYDSDENSSADEYSLDEKTGEVISMSKQKHRKIEEIQKIQSEEQQDKSVNDKRRIETKSNTFFIKQKSDKVGTFVIAKKMNDENSHLKSNATPATMASTMNISNEDDSNSKSSVDFENDETASNSSAGSVEPRLRRSTRSQNEKTSETAATTKDPLRKVQPQGRVTRLTERRKSMSAATIAEALRSNNMSPVKMTAVPKPKPPSGKGKKVEVAETRPLFKIPFSVKANQQNQVGTNETPYTATGMDSVEPGDTNNGMNESLIAISRVHFNDNIYDSNPSDPIAVNKKTCVDRSTQCDPENLTTDDSFLNSIKPQMAEMNARQKMNFKKKVFQSLMEIFDDATDFPGAGEVQHFNINTPTDFQGTTDGELRLMRELASLVLAAKRTGELIKSPKEDVEIIDNDSSSTKEVATKTVTKSQSPTIMNEKELGLPRHIIRRVIAMSENGGGTLQANEGEKKRVYRIYPKGTQHNEPQQHQNDKPNGNVATSGVGTFYLPSSNRSLTNGGTKTVSSTTTNNTYTLPKSMSVTARQYTLPTAGRTTSTVMTAPVRPPQPIRSQPVVSAKPAATTMPTPVAIQASGDSAGAGRVMMRRYSVCGTQAAAAAAATRYKDPATNKSVPQQYRVDGHNSQKNSSLTSSTHHQRSVNSPNTMKQPMTVVAANRNNSPINSPKIVNVFGSSSVGGGTVVQANTKKILAQSFQTPQNPSSSSASLTASSATAQQRGTVTSHPNVTSVGSTTITNASDGGLSKFFADSEEPVRTRQQLNPIEQNFQPQTAGTISADNFGAISIKSEPADTTDPLMD